MSRYTGRVGLGIRGGIKIRRFTAGMLSGLLLAAGVLTAIGYVTTDMTRSAPAKPTGPTQPQYLLILGVDERSQDQGRSDTMLLVRVAPAGPVRVLAIPRDTLVVIPGFGEGKANSAYAYGGPSLSAQTVSGLLHVPVEHYVKVNLAGFRRLVDLLGGVTLEIEHPMRYHDPDDGLLIDLQPGRQRLDGEQAEQFVRYRSDAIGDDLGRIQRQQAFLKAAASQLLTPAALGRLPALIAGAAESIQTDLDLRDQVALARALLSAQASGALLQETLPGHGDYVDGISFFLSDPIGLTGLLSAWDNKETHQP